MYHSKMLLITVLTLSLITGLFLVSTRARAQDKGAKPLDQRPTLVATAEPENPVVGFGGKLKIRLTLANNGGSAVVIPPGSLRLKPKGWSAWCCFGSPAGDDILMLPNDHPGAQTLVAAGASVTFYGFDSDVTAKQLGPMEARYSLVSDDPAAAALLPKQADLKVAFEVAPSELTSTIWAARTDADRDRLRPPFRDFLRLSARAEEIRDRGYIEGTLDYLAGYALPFLESALREDDPVVRRQAIAVCLRSAWAVGQLNAFLDHLDKKMQRPKWAAALVKADEKPAEAACIRMAVAGLSDSDARVRVAAVGVLADARVERALGSAKALASDPDPGVRSAAQQYLSKFAGAPAASDAIVTSLSDKSAAVREQALAALEHSPQAPALASLKRAFTSATGQIAAGLISLLFEQEDDTLPSALLEGYKARSAQERLAIMTAIAGHVDGPALEVVSLGLRDPAAEVQRAALMRLLTFPPEKALPLIQNYTESTSGTLREVAQAGRAEIEGRQLFPFLRGGSAASQVSAIESVFPSRNGTVPVVSPDGQWVAYVETGWGRPGGSGGTGRSNLLSLIHAVRADGTDDRLVSDMFLVGWLSDSRRIASARDGFAAICDLRGNVVSEFGQQLEEKWLKQYASRGDWRKGDPREQMGEEMPHQKRLSGLDKFDFGEDAAFSTDGKWYGPLRQNGDMVFISASGQISKIRPAEGLATRWQQASWSPDGKYVSLMGIHDDNALVIDVQDRTSQLIKGVDVIPNIESWAYRKGRWNPWSKDGGRLTFLRKGQVWVSKPDGTDAKQLTFDSSRKAFPTFSRGGRSIAYLSWQPDDRMHYTRVGPTDLWAVDVETGLATRVTAPSPGRIHSFEWLDDYTLIFDRLDPKGGVGYRSTLRRVSLL